MFDLERKKASFDQLQLSHLIYGGKENFDQFQNVLSVVSNDPIMKYDPTFLHQSRADMMTTYAKKALRFHSIYPMDGINE
jgi:acyl-CoA oxidase